MANGDDAPTHEQVTRWLRQLMTKGIRDVRADDVEELISLHAIRILALVDLPSARLAALHQRLRELMRSVENERLRRLAPFAFGTYSVDPLPLETRLIHAAQSGIGAQPRTLRNYLDQLATDMADKLVWLEERLRYNDWLDKPFEEALHDETLRQYDFLSAMAFWIEGARLDVEAALDAFDDEEFHDFAGSALWRWTRFLRVAHRFDEAWQGRWVFRADSKADLDEAIRSNWDAQAVPPIGPTERSYLRVELLATLQEELQPFLALLGRQEQGAKIVRKWFEWLRSCHCTENNPDPDCTVHRFLAEASTLYENINLEVSDHHRTDRAARFQTLPDVYEP